MKTTLEAGTKSNYNVTIQFDQADMDKFHTKALTSIQKDFEYKGFRKGHVPLDIVKQQTKPEYVSMVSFEEGINQALQQLVKENEDKQRIGQPYDLVPSEDGLTITLKLDVYPEIKANNQNYTKLTMKKINSDLTDAEIDDAMLNLRKQFATYDNTDIVQIDTSNRMRMEFLDKDGVQLDKGSLFVNEADFTEHELFKDLFVGKKVGETVELAYQHDKLPHVVHYHKDDQVPATVKFEIINAQTINIPDLNEDTISKLFGTSEVKTEEEVRVKVAEILAETKVENELTKIVDEYIDEAKASFDVQVPQTMINEEGKHRMESLKKQFGGDENFKKFVESKGDDEMKKMGESIISAATESLIKFFVFRTILESLDVTDINWEAKMDAEKKLYDKLVGGQSSDNSKKSKTIK